jgi:hypothetical protein
MARFSILCSNLLSYLDNVDGLRYFAFSLLWARSKTTGLVSSPLAHKTTYQGKRLQLLAMVAFGME